MPDIDLFTWWAISISFSSILLTLVSVYLYADSRSRRRKGSPKKTSAFQFGKDFVFVWVLLGLLVFYIYSIQIGAGVLSEEVFAVGNVIVEVLLMAYMLKNRMKSEQT
jgi:hypothetical protein